MKKDLQARLEAEFIEIECSIAADSASLNSPQRKGGSAGETEQ
ncbi:MULTISPECIES: hypothetical protein [unclassified Sphingobacterium]|nr:MULTISPECIES: hypothetical protein [unclassified Sphingobacterium]MCS3556163.1 hypothetical protein [Sphingobacterium sp. JUb21]TCR08539.1 hypothetical protein EDF66_10386 [Sphingobacterium sp. JUb20]